MKRVRENECRSILLEGLREFSSLCNNNNFRYYLAYGTLLGAVRHKGFIPWDDDIDVWMPREDYDKLIEFYSESKNSCSLWYLNAIEIEPKYWHSTAKFSHTKTIIKPPRFNNSYKYGLSIDIFPLDGISQDDAWGGIIISLSEKYQKYCKLLCIYKDNKSRLKGVIKRLFRYILDLLGMNYYLLYNWYIGRIRDLNRKDSIFFSCFEEKDIFNREWFEGDCELLFENGLYKVPSNYDAILKKRYGDYLKLPSEDERVGKHQFDVYYL